ncbi:hypothetical protein HDU86_006138 [Geranomyces michiganensis]|nr:hypothetical protein HDU86_006138 [Geranomyces michiganensis]
MDPIQTAFNTLLSIRKAVQLVKAKEKQCKRLAERAERAVLSLQALGERCSGKLETGAHLQALAFSNVLEKILQFFNRLNTKTFLHRFVTLHILDEELDDLSAQLDYLVADLSLSIGMDSRGLREQDAADRKADNEVLEQQLASLAADQQRILLTLGVGNNFVEALEAIKKTMASEAEESVKGKFAKAAYGALVRASGGADVEVKEWTITSYEVEIGEVFARGGFGEVCMGTWRGLTTVAVKRLPGGFETKKQKKAFVKEVEVWYKLRHPNVMLLFGACPSAVQPFMIMPFMENGTLLSYAEKNPQQILKLLNESAQGLHYLHTSNIVHGDLKAINILVDGAGIPKLADFGFSVLKAGNASIGTMRAGENMGGTIRWSAPECLEGAHPNFQSDVYAFGMVMWEVFSGGEIPFFRIQSELLVIKQVLAGARPDRPTGEVGGLCTDNLWELIQSCWTVERAHRPAMPSVAGGIARAMGRTSRPQSFSGISPTSPVKTPSSMNLPVIGETAPPYTSQPAATTPTIVLESTLVEEPASGVSDEKSVSPVSNDPHASATSAPSAAEEKRALGVSAQLPQAQSRELRDQALAPDTLPTASEGAQRPESELLQRKTSHDVEPAQLAPKMRIPQSASFTDVKDVNGVRQNQQYQDQAHLVAPHGRKRSATETGQWPGDRGPGGIVHSVSFNDGHRSGQGPNPPFDARMQYQQPPPHQYANQQPPYPQHHQQPRHQQYPQQQPPHYADQRRNYMEPSHQQPHAQHSMHPQSQMPSGPQNRMVGSDPRVAMDRPPGAGPMPMGEPRPGFGNDRGHMLPPPNLRPQSAQPGDIRYAGGDRSAPPQHHSQQQQPPHGRPNQGNQQLGGPHGRIPADAREARPGANGEFDRRPGNQPNATYEKAAAPTTFQQHGANAMPGPGPIGPGNAPGANQRVAGASPSIGGPPQPQQQQQASSHQPQQIHNRRMSAAGADPRMADAPGTGMGPHGNVKLEQPGMQPKSHQQQQQPHDRRMSAAGADPRMADAPGISMGPQGTVKPEQHGVNQQAETRPPGPTNTKSTMSITPTTVHAGMPPSASFPTKAGAWSLSPTATGVAGGSRPGGSPQAAPSNSGPASLSPDSGASGDRSQSNSGGPKQGVLNNVANSARLEEGEALNEPSLMVKAPPSDPKQDQAAAAALKKKQRRGSRRRRCCICCMLLLLLIVAILVVGFIGKLKGHGFFWSG